MKRTGIYGIMAEFDSVHTLLAAANRTREAGYKRIDAYSPFPIEGLAEAIGFHRDEVPLVVLIGGIMEHIEEAGVHSGDSACALPPITLGRGDIRLGRGELAVDVDLPLRPDSLEVLDLPLQLEQRLLELQRIR